MAHSRPSREEPGKRRRQWLRAVVCLREMRKRGEDPDELLEQAMAAIVDVTEGVHNTDAVRVGMSAHHWTVVKALLGAAATEVYFRESELDAGLLAEPGDQL